MPGFGIPGRAPRCSRGWTARLMLDEARAHPDEIVRPAPVHAMPRLAALAGGIRCHDLVAVGDGARPCRRCHPHHGQMARTAPRAPRACGRAGWDRERTATRNRHTGRHGGMYTSCTPRRRRHSSPNSRSLRTAKGLKGSISSVSPHEQGPSLRSAPQRGHRPAQSSLHRMT